MKEIKFGIAGYGKMGKIREKSILDSMDATLISIYDIADNEHHDENIILCDSYDKLLETNIDAVIVSAFVKVAAEYVIRALDAGKHVFCEKPPAMTSVEMAEVIKAEKKSGKILKYGFNHRFHYSVIEAKKLVNTGTMGKMLWMRGVYGKAGSIDFHDNWRNYKNYSGGGILLDQGIHMLDLFRYFSNAEYKCISSHLTTSFWDIECEDNAFLVLKSDKNIIATLHSSATQWKHKFLLEMAFEGGYINLDGILSSTRSYAPETLIVGQREFEDVTFAMGKPKESITYFEYDNSWELELAEFVQAVKGESPVVNGTSKDAFEIMKLTDHVYGYSSTN
ncbi:MAG: Gfo/Idh/MocA family oxidoreductase [Candidatus Marinimicrobia bacterium]|nr:Gfo/Idh/MocA family oxidoreductase [Candidatus Neomarinimicrobiota bacterium]MBT6472568.1 Gfo/Idh/MocA family oxidoreductase [Candidatus Neomarinimicrobiota bacterium]MBT6936516.1 Gfo/Idh/MocA family oxidoreductase [Candidatus Neomarinimicrobiota bacterium]